MTLRLEVKRDQKLDDVGVMTKVELIAYRVALPQRITNIWNNSCAIGS
jgi:hypothetical protein